MFVLVIAERWRYGHYLIEIDDQVFRRLKELDPDIFDRAILCEEKKCSR